MPLNSTLLAGLMITQNPLEYVERLDIRVLDSIQGVVIHCTETPDIETAREFGENIVYSGSQTGNSGHFYINLDGRIEQYVPLIRIAHHVADHNQNTIGIELVNKGRWPDWMHSEHQQPQDAYPEVQITALIHLLQQLEQLLPELTWITGHQDLDTRLVKASNDSGLSVARKIDPGPLFPWAKVLDASRLVRPEAIDKTN